MFGHRLTGARWLQKIGFGEGLGTGLGCFGEVRVLFFWFLHDSAPERQRIILYRGRTVWSQEGSGTGLGDFGWDLEVISEFVTYWPLTGEGIINIVNV